MNRKLTLVSVVLVLALAALACGGSDRATAPSAATEEPVAPSPTAAPTESGEEPEVEAEEEPVSYDTVFPLPDDVQNFVGEGGESQISFQTRLSIEEAIAFYRKVLDDAGLTEYEVLTSIQDDGFSLVFASWPSGEEVVVQGVDFDDSVNISIRLEEVIEGEINPPPPDTELGEELRSEVGGYACQTIPGYTVEEAFGFASMEAPDADPELGPAVLLIGGAVEDEGGKTAQDLYDDFVSDLEGGIEVSEPGEITVGGATGLVADVEGAVEGQRMSGRLVFVAVSPSHHFTALSVAPADLWDDLAPLFEAVVASITFFEPGDAFDLENVESEEGMAVEGEETLINQWATSAIASSEYSNPGWAAGQATGAPDTAECGDYQTAWASLTSDGVDWLELGYDFPIVPVQIDVYESHSPGFIVRVEVVDEEGYYHTVWEGEPSPVEECPRIFSIPVIGVDVPVVGVRIHLDQHAGGNWDEIDAVELIGVERVRR
jgi:hypothetical protein